MYSICIVYIWSSNWCCLARSSYTVCAKRQRKIHYGFVAFQTKRSRIWGVMGDIMVRCSLVCDHHVSVVNSNPNFFAALEIMEMDISFYAAALCGMWQRLNAPQLRWKPGRQPDRQVVGAFPCLNNSPVREQLPWSADSY